jgi:hypothetical protein
MTKPRPKSTRDLLAPHLPEIERELVRRRIAGPETGGSP